MTNLFSEFNYNNFNLKNRIIMSPMCQYSVDTYDGMPNKWHEYHYVNRSIGGVGLITIEMTAISPEGRSTNRDLGLWSDDHIPAFKSIIDACKLMNNTKVSIQISHAGRKAQDSPSSYSASDIAFSDKYPKPKPLDILEIEEIIMQYALAAERAVIAGADAIELHGAHGYLIHQFHSPLTNFRNDEYSDNVKFGVEVIKGIKSIIPKEVPLIMRISAVEYSIGGYDLDFMIKVSKSYKEAGVDIFSISSGGESSFPDDYAGHHIPFSRKIKEELNIPIIVAGVLDNPSLADSIIRNSDADLIAIGRGLLRNPYWPLNAAIELKAEKQLEYPKQYMRAF